MYVRGSMSWRPMCVLACLVLGACGADQTGSGSDADTAGPGGAKTSGKAPGQTDVGCGGANAPKCAVDRGCQAPTDCESGVCTASKCAAPSPTDGVKNGTETDADCGGGGAPKCAVGKG